MPGGDGSMFETVKNHEERILILEEADQKHEERLRVVESNYTNLENTILKGNQSQQDFFRDTMNKQWDLITERDKTKEATAQRDHEITVSNQDIKKTNSERAWEFAGKLTALLLSSGSILYVILEMASK